MSRLRPVVIHREEATARPTTPGLDVRHHADPDGRWVGWSGWTGTMRAM
jgi:hypothetical protein